MARKIPTLLIVELLLAVLLAVTLWPTDLPREQPAGRPQLHPRPAATRRVTPAHRAVHRSTVHRAVYHRPVIAATPPVTFRTLLMAAVRDLPGYQPGDATWVVTTRFGSWGAADLATGVVYVSPRVPTARLFDVVAHEWAHLLSVRPYDGDVAGALAAMNRWFGGRQLEGAERAADCMARLMGAVWTHYTRCDDAHWRAGAARLLAGSSL